MLLCAANRGGAGDGAGAGGGSDRRRSGFICQCATGACPLVEREALRHGVGVRDAVDDGDGGEHRQHPECGRHHAPALEERAEDDKYNALRPLHETDLAGTDESLGAGAGVADHQ